LPPAAKNSASRLRERLWRAPLIAGQQDAAENCLGKHYRFLVTSFLMFLGFSCRVIFLSERPACSRGFPPITRLVSIPSGNSSIASGGQDFRQNFCDLCALHPFGLHTGLEGSENSLSVPVMEALRREAITLKARRRARVDRAHVELDPRQIVVDIANFTGGQRREERISTTPGLHTTVVL